MYTTVLVGLDTTCVPYLQYRFMDENILLETWKFMFATPVKWNLFFSDTFYCLVQKYTLIVFGNDCIIG